MYRIIIVKRKKKERKRQISLHSRETTACQFYQCFLAKYQDLNWRISGICAKHMEVVVMVKTFVC